MVETFFKELFVVIDDNFTIDKVHPTIIDFQKKIENYELLYDCDLKVYRKPNATREKISIVIFNGVECFITNYKK